jgi:hypothetical protein
LQPGRDQPESVLHLEEVAAFVCGAVIRRKESFAVGLQAKDLKQPVNDQKFDDSIQFVFTNKAVFEKYSKSEKHQKFIEENKVNWKKARVFDSFWSLESQMTLESKNNQLRLLQIADLGRAKEVASRAFYNFSLWQDLPKRNYRKYGFAGIDSFQQVYRTVAGNLTYYCDSIWPQSGWKNP